MLDDKAVEAVLALDDGRRKALLSRDISTLSSLLHQDLIWVHASGKTEDRQAYIDSIESGRTQLLSLALLERQARIDEGALLVAGVLRIGAKVGENFHDITNGFDSRWVQAREGWQLISWRSFAAPTKA